MHINQRHEQCSESIVHVRFILSYYKRSPFTSVGYDIIDDVPMSHIKHYNNEYFFSVVEAIRGKSAYLW